MYLRPQGREPQRSKHLRKEDSFIPKPCWLLSHSRELGLALTSKAGAWQTHFVETEVVLLGGRCTGKDKYERDGEELLCNISKHTTSEGVQRRKREPVISKAKSKLKTPRSPTSTQSCTEAGESLDQQGLLPPGTCLWSSLEEKAIWIGSSKEYGLLLHCPRPRQWCPPPSGVHHQKLWGRLPPIPLCSSFFFVITCLENTSSRHLHYNHLAQAAIPSHLGYSSSFPMASLHQLLLPLIHCSPHRQGDLNMELSWHFAAKSLLMAPYWPRIKSKRLIIAYKTAWSTWPFF